MVDLPEIAVRLGRLWEAWYSSSSSHHGQASASTALATADAEARDLLRQLRHEAESQKSCFTDQTDQALKFATAVIPIIITASHFRGFVAPAALLVTFVLIGVSRTGIYKYGSANRSLAYQLHLARVRRLFADNERLLRRYLTLDWEEACRAWRVMQPAIFSTVYHTPQYSLACKVPGWKHFHPGLYKRQKGSSHEYAWYLPTELTAAPGGRSRLERLRGPKSVTDPGARTYHAGTYLRNAQERLLVLQVFSLLPLAMATQISPSSGPEWPQSTLWTLFLIGLAMVVLRWILTYRRIRILEGELGSIHSCAIVWHAVVAAHLVVYYSSDSTDHTESSSGWTHYTEDMATKARQLVDHGVENIHSWIDAQEEQLATLI